MPEIAKWAGLRTYKFADPTGLHHSLTNHNKLLPGTSHAYPWATGFKTGYTSTPATRSRRPHRTTAASLIAVIMNTYDTYGWAAQLFDQGSRCRTASGTGDAPPAWREHL